ncbi:unnamed protein product, partial [Arabidopsis halleri]
EDGFTQVRSRGRRSEAQKNKMVTPTSEIRPDMARSSRGLGKGKGIANIAIANSFGSLNVDMETEVITEGVMTQGANKENVDPEIQQVNEKSGTQGKKIVFGTESIKGQTGPSGPNGVSKERMSGNSKGPVNHQYRPKINKVQKPTKGLVFGPSREESVLSANGKRLRVERNNLG